jgi:hypothetical protein
MKSTSGSWSISTIALHNPDRFTVISGQIEVARIEPRRFDDEENKANARLIAAAPELLAAAEMVVAHFNGMKRGALSPSLTRAVDASNAAIQKAKGTP